MEIDLEFLCDEICSLLDSNGITDDDIPELWPMIEKFAGAVLKKYNKAQKAAAIEEED